MNNIIAQFNIPNMTSKQYDQTWVELRTQGQSNPQDFFTISVDNKAIIGWWLMFGNQ